MLCECPRCQARIDTGSAPPGTEIRCSCGNSFAAPSLGDTAATLRCPQCGAACTQDEAQCRFCGVVLGKAPCARCLGRLLPGTKFCPHCGAEVERSALPIMDGQVSARRCPRCPGRTTLHFRRLGATRLEDCERCGGAWLEREEFQRLVAEQERQMAILEAQLPPAAAPFHETALLDGAPVAHLQCPDCGNEMYRNNFAESSGVIIDVCKRHGVWFDADELRAVVSFVRSGGLAMTRERERLQTEVESAKVELTPLSTTGGADPDTCNQPFVLASLIDMIFG